MTGHHPRGYLRDMDASTLSAAVIGLAPARAALWAVPVSEAFDRFGIDTLDRQAAFLAQCGHESAGFGITREIWGRDGGTPAQQRYEGRVDLGNTEPGDGSKFRGRGLIQITGRANYAACAVALGLDLLNHPELLEAPEGAALSAGWFWQTHGLNDVTDFVALTKRINGGTNGLADREARWEHAKSALGL